jgi:hypothetical protein
METRACGRKMCVHPLHSFCGRQARYETVVPYDVSLLREHLYAPPQPLA